MATTTSPRPGYTSRCREVLLLLDREPKEEAEAAVRFHTGQFATALHERTALDGPWGLLGRLWRTHARAVAHWDARIAYHHQELGRAKARRADTSSPPSEAASTPGVDLEAIADRLRATEHPMAEELRAVEDELAILDAAHELDARLHRAGAALVAAVRGRTEMSTGGLTGGWPAGSPEATTSSAPCRPSTRPAERP